MRRLAFLALLCAVLALLTVVAVAGASSITGHSSTSISMTFDGYACGQTHTFTDDTGQTLIGSTDPCSPPPPPPPPVNPSPPELIFPGTPGPAGFSLPERACGDPSPSSNCASEGGFNRSDYEGWATLNGVNERMSWQLDPAGSSKTVSQFEVYGDDNADQYGGTRASLWRNADNCTGCEAWQAFAIYLPLNFQYPDGWFLLYQDFSSGGNPAQSLELMGAGCASAIPRDHLCWKDQTAPSSGINRFDLGPVQLGHWFYIVEDIKFLNTSAGFDKVWLGWDALPDLTQAPLVNWQGITAYTTGANRSNIMLYRAASSHTQHQVAYYCGFHRAADALTATQLPDC